MGHDIYAYKASPLTGKTFKGPELAYVSFSAFDGIARDFYAALDAQEFDGGCSGTGCNKTHSPAQIRAALERTPSGDLHDQQREFFQTCLAKCEGSPVVISFR